MAGGAEMTVYLNCTECGWEVPWYYGFHIWGVPHDNPMHPYCCRDRIDEEGCGPVFFAARIAIDELKSEATT